jgi:hypothetical protein
MSLTTSSIESNLAAISHYLGLSVLSDPTGGEVGLYAHRVWSPRFDLEVGQVSTNTIWWIAGVLLVIVLVIVIIRMI